MVGTASEDVCRQKNDCLRRFQRRAAGKRRLESQTNAENRFAYAGRNRKADKVEKFAELRRRTAQISSGTGKAYSWWSYRNPNWQTNNKGRRLDHIWTTPNLEDRLVAVKILKEARNWERPSDHVPVIAEIKC